MREEHRYNGPGSLKGDQQCISDQNSMEQGLEPPRPHVADKVDSRHGGLHDTWFA